MKPGRIGRLHVITDTTLQKRFTHEQLAALACAGGADVIQLRDKFLSDEDLLAVARRLRATCDAYGATLIVNDRVAVALACVAGVHVGREDMPVAEARRVLGPDAWIGTSTSSTEEAREAERAGADYAGFGHVFATASKSKQGAPIGLEALRAAGAAVSIPLIAIGGITPENARDAVRAGAWGVAVIGAVVCAGDPEAATRLLRAAVDGA